MKRNIMTIGTKNPVSISPKTGGTARKSPDGAIRGKAGAPRPERTKQHNIGRR